MRVLVTGHRGFIGSVLTSVLRHARFDVFGLDAGWFEGCEFGRVREEVPSFDADIRDLEYADLLSFDAVIHLAGVSDDPSGALNAELTHAVNVEGTLRLAECCRRANVGRFIFASSCSVYGSSGAQEISESAGVHPLSVYAASKARAEAELFKLADRSFVPVVLRLGTVYGMSPSLRLDLLVNDLTASVVTTGRAVMRSNGQAWRPLVHVEDAARVFAAILAAPDEAVDRQVYHVVPPDGTHRVIDVADLVADSVPGAVRVMATNQRDRRSYRVSAGKFREAFPAFRYRWNLAHGIRQLVESFRAGGLSAADWRGDRYRRAARLQSLIERGVMGNDLRRVAPAVA